MLSHSYIHNLHYVSLVFLRKSQELGLSKPLFAVMSSTELSEPRGRKGATPLDFAISVNPIKKTGSVDAKVKGLR